MGNGCTRLDSGAVEPLESAQGQSEVDPYLLAAAKDLNRVAPLDRPAPVPEHKPVSTDELRRARQTPDAPAGAAAELRPAETPGHVAGLTSSTPKPLSVRTISTALDAARDPGVPPSPDSAIPVPDLQRANSSKTPRAMQRMSGIASTTARAPLSLLRRFVPSLVAEFYVDHTSTDPGWNPKLPMWSSLPGAVLLADMSGFTPLSERLSAKGVGGIEELSRHLNAYFAQMIEIILSMGGDIVKFAGDALLVLWADTSPSREGRVTLTDLTVLAADCALTLHRNLHGYSPVPGVTLSLHSGIGAGTVYAAHVGGFQSRREFIIHGKPLRQLRQAVDLARDGELVLSAEASSLLPNAAHRALQATHTGGCFVLRSLDGVDIPGLPNRSTAATTGDHFAATQYLRTYVPSFLLPRLDATSHARLAELRTITTLFISLPDVDPESMGEAVSFAQMQSIVVIVQEAANRYRGSIRQLITDDKGTVMIVVFGLIAQDDSAYNGIRSAVRMYRKCRNMTAETKVDHDLSIGVATGGAFCGLVGNRHRREYAVVGDRVNLAARLMSKAHKQILVDHNSYQAAEGTVARRGNELKGLLTFTELPAIRVKGKAAPIATYCPEYISSHVVAHAKADTFSTKASGAVGAPVLQQASLVGRFAMMSTIRNYMTKAGDWHRNCFLNSNDSDQDRPVSRAGTPVRGPSPAFQFPPRGGSDAGSQPPSQGASPAAAAGRKQLSSSRSARSLGGYMPVPLSRTPTKGIGALFVVGHEGMGKSAALSATASIAEDNGFKTLTCRTDSRRRNVPYAAIRGVVAQLLMCFDADATAGKAMATRLANPAEALRAAVVCASEHLPETVREHLPLLTMVLDNLSLPPTETSRMLVGVARGHALENLVLHLFYAYTRIVITAAAAQQQAKVAARAEQEKSVAGGGGKASGRSRASRRRSIYGGCVQPTAGVLVLCDDAHLLDRHSLHLLIRLIREPHCIVVISSRPVLTADAASGAPPPPMGNNLSPGAAKTFWEVLSTDSRTTIMELEALTPLDASLLAADELAQLSRTQEATRRCSVTHVSGGEEGKLEEGGNSQVYIERWPIVEAADLQMHSDVVDIIWQHTGGNPGFVKAFVGHLRQEELIVLEKTVEGTQTALSVSFRYPERIHTLKLPTSVQASIGSRVDTLPADAHLLLKLCSVIGRTVEGEMLKDILPHLHTRTTASGSWTQPELAELPEGESKAGSPTSDGRRVLSTTSSAASLLNNGSDRNRQPTTIDERMEMLCDMGFLEFAGYDETGSARIYQRDGPGEPDRLTTCYDFKLPAVRDVVYERLTYKDRADFHRRVAHWYETRREELDAADAGALQPAVSVQLPRRMGSVKDSILDVDALALVADGESADAPEVQDSVIAYHWRKCAKYETHHTAAQAAKVKAMRFLLRAGRATASKQFSNDQAMRLFKEALNIVRELPDRNSEEHMLVELEILARFGPFTIEGVPGYEAAADRYRRMLQLSEDLPGQPYRFAALVGRFHTRLLDCTRLLPISLAMQTAEEIDAHGTSSTAEEVELGHLRTVVRVLKGEYVLAEQSAVAACEIYSAAEHHRNTFMFAGHDPAVCTLAMRAVACLLMGDLDESFEALEQSVGLAEQLEDPASLLHAHSIGALLAMVLRAPALIISHCEAALPLCLEHESLAAGAPALKVLHAVVDVEETESSARERNAYTIEQPFREAKANATSGELAMLWTLLLPLAPLSIYSTVGRFEDAIRVAEMWLSDLRQTQLSVVAECHRQLGLLRLHQARELAAEAGYDEHYFAALCCDAARSYASAIDTAYESHARFLELRALTSMLDMLVATDLEAAKEALAEVLPADPCATYVARLKELFAQLDNGGGSSGVSSAQGSPATSRRSSMMPLCLDLVDARRVLEQHVRKSIEGTPVAEVRPVM